MSNEINIFVASKESLEEFGAQIEHILDIKFNPEDVERLKQNPERIAFALIDDDLKRSLRIWSRHPRDYFVDDGDKLFSNYSYEISVYAWGGEGWAEKDRNTRAFADWIFDKLKATNQYPLMMLKGVHPKLAQFDPVPPTES